MWGAQAVAGQAPHRLGGRPPAIIAATHDAKVIVKAELVKARLQAVCPADVPWQESSAAEAGP